MFKSFWLNRPVSPHLSIYASQISSLSSIWHRLTGVFLVFFLIAFTFMLYNILNFSFFFQISIFASKNYFFLFFVVIFLYHSFSGIRHILWDLGYLFDLKNINFSFYVNLFFLCVSLVIYIINI